MNSNVNAKISSISNSVARDNYKNNNSYSYSFYLKTLHCTLIPSILFYDLYGPVEHYRKHRGEYLIIPNYLCGLILIDMVYFSHKTIIFFQSKSKL